MKSVMNIVNDDVNCLFVLEIKLMGRMIIVVSYDRLEVMMI